MAETNKISAIEAKKIQEIMNDPVKWAQIFITNFDNVKKQYTPWIARWYQVEMLRDRSVKKVARCGRRTGKCLTGDDLILDAVTGELISVKKAFEKGKTHLGTMTDDYQLKAHATNEIWENGIKPVYELTTKTGRSIKATGNHPFFTIEGWKEIDELNTDDYVALANNNQFFGNEAMRKDELKLLAYMIGDGNCTKKTIRFSSINPMHIKEMKDICNSLNCELVQYDSNNYCDFNIVKKHNKENKNYPNPIKSILINYDLYEHDAFEKRIPKEIFKLNKKLISLFLNRLYATDGWACISDNKRQIGYASVNLQLIKDIQHLLLRFGINSRIETKKSSYTLSIFDSKNAKRFCKEIGIYGKEDAIKKVLESCIEDKSDLIPAAIHNKVLQLAELKGLNKTDLCIDFNERVRVKSNITKAKLKQYAEILNDEDLMNLSNTEMIFDKIVSIKYIGQEMTYDVAVSITNNFIANDFVTHNTETMCIEMLWKAFTKKKHRILVVTPYETQVRLIFTRLRELIADSPMLNAELARSTKNPYWIEFKNGAIILGFTTGASSGSGAASIRGQKADSIYMDEVDYMSEADFDSVLAIAGERRDIAIFMSSTPTGKRSKFWAACTKKEMGFVEHFHPSMHNPNWGPEMEAEFRAQLSEQGFVHEIQAEFGTQDTGVFDKNKVDASRNVLCYAYNELDFYQKAFCEKEKLEPQMLLYDKSHKAPFNPFRCMGVDWDKYQASSSLLIMDYDVITQKFKVIKRVEVPRGEYSYDNAVNLIIELNEIYNPSWIYCDAGAGEYQIETLQKYGDEHPASGLKNKVKRWQFKQSIEIQNPVTFEMHKEPLKPFMITQLQIAFERQRLVLSPFDDVLHKQLIDYEVVKISSNGNPIFTSQNEHFVDALGLANLAFVLEFPELTDVIKKTEVKAIIDHSRRTLGQTGLNRLFNSIETSAVPKGYSEAVNKVLNSDPNERRGDKQTYVKVNTAYRSGNSSGSSWGSRSSGNRGGASGRSMW